MIDFLIFVIGSIGMAHILVNGEILEPVRELLRKILPEFLSNGLSCSQCLGFWSGLFCGYVMLSDNFWIVLVLGFAGSFLANLADWFLLVLESKTEIESTD